MRKITDKDLGGLLAALRAFTGHLSGERLSRKKGLALLEKALLFNGNTVDELLNKENWGRAAAACPGLTAEGYVDALANRDIEVRELRAETGWDDPVNGFALVAEATHDFYMELTRKGGKWNIPSALKNLADAIRAYGLQSILSEKTVRKVNDGRKDAVTCYAYIEALLKDPSLIEPEGETDAQQERREEEENMVDLLIAQPSPNMDEMPDFPEEEESIYLNGIETPVDAETSLVVKESPSDVKKRCVLDAIQDYTLSDMSHLFASVKGDGKLTFAETVERIALGLFDPSTEDDVAQNVHKSLNADLVDRFVDCVRMQGVEMSREVAERYDILHEGWDLRSDEMRRLHKVKALIFAYGEDDPDLLEAVKDLERMYLGTEETENN